MNGIDAKWVFYLGLIVTIETAIGNGTVSLTNVVPLEWAPYIKAWCDLLAFIGTALMTAMSGYSSASKGPLAKVAVLIAAGAMFLLLIGPADAQTRLQSAAQRNDVNAAGQSPLASLDVKGLIDRFDQAKLEDLTLALAYATADEDRAAMQCYQAWLEQVKKFAELRQANPDPDGVQIISVFQKARGLVRRLDTSSPLRIACAALAADAKQDVRQLLGGILSGAALKIFSPL